MKTFPACGVPAPGVGGTPSDSGMDLDRRRFLIVAGRLVVVVPLGLNALGCGAYGDGDGGDDGDPVRTDGTIRYTSSSNSGHRHTFDLAVAAIETPPAGGVSGPTSTSGGHAHAVTVTAVQLAAIDGGETVTVTTTSGGGHVHSFALRKV